MLPGAPPPPPSVLEIIPGDNHYLAITAICVAGLNLAAFGVSYALQIDKVRPAAAPPRPPPPLTSCVRVCTCVDVQLTDFVGSFSFILATLLPLCANGVYAPRQIAVTVCVLAARLELAGYLLYRVLRRGRDERFDSIRSNFGAFLGFWIGQVSACAA
jgi:hypothetical protein